MPTNRRAGPAGGTGVASGLLLLTALALTGCGSRFRYAEVEGVVTRNGTPLPQVEVVFMPDPDHHPGGPDAAAFTDTQGRYRLRTRRSNQEGVVVGTHRVCVFDMRQPDNSKLTRVPPGHGSPATTPFQGVEVRPGGQTVNMDVGTGSLTTQ